MSQQCWPPSSVASYRLLARAPLSATVLVPKMTFDTSKAQYRLVTCVVAFGLFGSLVALALGGAGGPSAPEVAVIVTGSLALLLLVYLPLRHQKLLDEAHNIDSERLSHARAAAELHMRAV